MRAPSDAVTVRAVNGEKEEEKERERGIDSVSAPIGHHSLTPLSVAIWEGQTSLERGAATTAGQFAILRL